MTFKEFVEQEEMMAEELGFDQNEPSTFQHFVLLRIAYKTFLAEESLSMIKANTDILVDKALSKDI